MNVVLLKRGGPEASAAISSRIEHLLREKWRASRAPEYGFPYEEFEALLASIGVSCDFGRGGSGKSATEEEQAAFFHSLHASDLVLARACAAGHEAAWESFFLAYRETIRRAASAIARDESAASELADSLYAELYGLKVQGGVRSSPLASYSGRGSLAGWLRTVLAQRFVDRYRRTRREVSLEGEGDGFFLAAEKAPEQPSGSVALVTEAVQAALRRMQPEEKFLLAAYYLDQRTLGQIAQVLDVHESTVSRKLGRVVKVLRKQVLKHLISKGMDRRSAEEAMGIDVRDMNIDIRKFLQSSGEVSFLEKKGKSVIGHD